RTETTRSGDAPESWLLDLIRRTHLIHQLLVPLGWLFAKAARMPIKLPSFPNVTFAAPVARGRPGLRARIGDAVWAVLVIALTVFVVWRVVTFVRTGVTLDVLTAETLRTDLLDLWTQGRLPIKSVLIVT
ncbi:sulfonate ABC transporter permease, partial [Paraburkholderia sp. BR14261]